MQIYVANVTESEWRVLYQLVSWFFNK